MHIRLNPKPTVKLMNAMVPRDKLNSNNKKRETVTGSPHQTDSMIKGITKPSRISKILTKAGLYKFQKIPCSKG